ncbi:MAG TPA: pyridoxamine 5'-phosphate oxidase [Acidimicrobiia bacterium]|nr:pyridoxamine 5'-phosphate oxidase [Acidimicrobiia bacterium]HTC80933.1 pyridoxamine 5'-phosphate oxidase [Acidimicrobiia bacterium]
MATWSEVEAAVPELAAVVRAAFDAHRHKVLATLRADGSPRLSGNEASFRGGDLWLGMMHRSRKALDLERDSRMELHSAPVDLELKLGDAKLAGRAVEVTDPEVIRRFAAASAEEHAGVEPPAPFHLFRVDIGEVTLIRVGDPPDHLVIESWSPAAGHRRTERR